MFVNYFEIRTIKDILKENYKKTENLYPKFVLLFIIARSKISPVNKIVVVQFEEEKKKPRRNFSFRLIKMSFQWKNIIIYLEI